MLRRLGQVAVISSQRIDIENASKLILPGVGSFDSGMQNLQDLNLTEILNRKVLVEKVPVLGICLGVQLMCKNSEEGLLPGLAWFDAEVLSFKGRFLEGQTLPVPNMGWREVTVERENALCINLPIEPRYYFVHSYFIKPNQENEILMSSNYGFEYTVALQRSNIYGVQFHPEKSHKYGFHLLKNFAEVL
jgi:glutamine amidotransferase